MVVTRSRPGVPTEVRRSWIATGALLTCTLFVWLGRIRNALVDPALQGSDRVGPLLLAMTFVVPALVLAVGWVVALRRSSPLAPWAAWTLWALAVWTVGVWAVRIVDIAFAGDHSIGFVAVHVVLAVVSSGCALWAVAAERRVLRARHTSPVTASHQNMA